MSSVSLDRVKRSQRLAPLIAAALLVSVVPAGAQEREARTAQHAQAVDLFQQSRAAYRDGHFKEAADLLQRAYAVEPAPILLYNLARAYEGLGDLPHAIDAYQRYLKESPDAKDRGATEERIRTLTRSHLVSGSTLSGNSSEVRGLGFMSPARRHQKRLGFPILSTAATANRSINTWAAAAPTSSGP